MKKLLMKKLLMNRLRMKKMMKKKMKINKKKKKLNKRVRLQLKTYEHVDLNVINIIKNRIVFLKNL